MRLAHVNYAFDPRLQSAHDLLRAYHTLTGWSDAAAMAGLSVDVVQAFGVDARVRRGAVTYSFHACHGWRRRGCHAMHRAIAALDADVVHVNGLDMVHYAWRLRRHLAPHTAIVVQDHGGGTAPPGRSIGGAVRRHMMRAVDGFLFTSLDQARPWIEGRFIASAAAVHAVPEASTELAPMDRAAARAMSGMSGDPAVLWVGRLDANKDPLTVLDAFGRALDLIPRATLTMVYTDASLLPEVTARITASDRLRSSVCLAGRVERQVMAAYYSAADVFVLGSAREAAGYALIEACACGVTPVVSDIAPFRAITGDGAIGRLWQRRNAERCAAALVDIAHVNREQERDRVLGHFARHLSWPVVGQRAAAAYLAVIEQHRDRQDAAFARGRLSSSPCRAEQPTSNASSITERPSSMR